MKGLHALGVALTMLYGLIVYVLLHGTQGFTVWERIGLFAVEAAVTGLALWAARRKD